MQVFLMTLKISFYSRKLKIQNMLPKFAWFLLHGFNPLIMIPDFCQNCTKACNKISIFVGFSSNAISWQKYHLGE